MKVLMFGWEFPPNISGGLGTACYGITKSLAAIPGTDITFIIPKAYGNESKNNIQLIGANQVDLIRSKIRRERLQFPATCYSIESQIVPYVDPRTYETLNEYKVEKTGTTIKQTHTPTILFTGKYGPNLMSEIHNFSVVSEYLASQQDFDVIHAHDWLTFPAGIAAKQISHKPLVVHVHATDFDRSGGQVNPDVYRVEKEGMDHADAIITVSNHTRRIVIEKYHIPPMKVITVHNAVEPVSDSMPDPAKLLRKEKIVTFLGRITMQKGPEYFVRIATQVLSRMKNVRFVMAGSGDLYTKMISLVAKAGISNRFHFTGFLKGPDVLRMLKLSDIYVMPSVSEPFGISPLEAMQCGVPTIISKQSGVSEIIRYAIKADFWDVNAMADAICDILNCKPLYRTLAKKGKKEVERIRWDKPARKIREVYQQVLITA
jgi:glycosyltransferase involved in cell wall biosynthesis